MPRRSRGKKIDQLRWLGFAATAGALAAGSIGVLVLAADTFADTIMRTRGQLLAFVDGTPAPGAFVQVAVGAIIVPEGTGTTVLWSPIADENADWFWYTRFALGYEEPVVNVVDVPGAAGYRETIDSKAMRVSKPDTEVQIVFEQSTLASSMAINLSVLGRFLLGR